MTRLLTATMKCLHIIHKRIEHMIFSIIFWTIVLFIWFLNSQRSRFLNQGYRIAEKYRVVQQEETTCLKMIELTELSLCELNSNSMYLLEQVTEDLVKEKISSTSQKYTKEICLRIVRYCTKHPKRSITGLNFCVIVKFFICYPLVTVLAISAFIAVFSYLSVRSYVGYLPTMQHILFYLIPFALFTIPMLISYRRKGEWHWQTAQKSFIIAFWVSFGISLFAYDWGNAKVDYEDEMEELFGEEWEDEVEEMEHERFYRR